jgi:hypothetical protein
MVIVFPILIAAVPFITIWGWWRWTKLRQPRTLASDLSLIGFGLATLSALLAVITWIMASTRGFAFYDPLLLAIYKVGLLLALGGMILGLSGLWRPGPLRWHAPLCSLAMLVFWFIAASSE